MKNDHRHMPSAFLLLGVSHGDVEFAEPLQFALSTFQKWRGSGWGQTDLHAGGAPYRTLFN